MGACFQAPCAAPIQRQMEMHHVHLIKFIFQYVPATRSYRFMYIQDKTMQHNGIHYNNNDDSNM